MSWLVIEGLAVPVAEGSDFEDEPWGDIEPSFNDTMRSDVRARHLTKRVTTVELESDDALALRLILRSPGALRCSGDWVEENFSVDEAFFHVVGPVRVRPLTATDSVLAFTLRQTRVTASPLLWSFDGDAPGVYTFARTGSPSNAWYPDENGIYQQAAEGEPRFGYLDLDGDGEYETRAYFGDPAATNELLDSADVDPDDANWDENAAWTQATAVPLFAGGASKKFTNDGATGSHGINQAVDLSGSARVQSFILEQVNALVSTINIWDATAVGAVIQATYTWATGAIVVDGNPEGSSPIARARVLAESGPNGGRVVRLEVSAIADTPANTGAAIVYPTGTGVNSLSAIVHHAQYEAGTVATSPIVTDGSTKTRNLETINTPFLPTPTEIEAMGGITVYVDSIEAGTVLGGGPLVHFGSSSIGSTPRLTIQADGSGFYQAVHGHSAGNVVETLAAAPVVGDRVEHLLQFRPSTGIVFRQSIGAAADTGGSEGSARTPDAALAGALAHLNGPTTFEAGRNHIIRVRVFSEFRSFAQARTLAAARLHPRIAA